MATSGDFHMALDIRHPTWAGTYAITSRPDSGSAKPTPPFPAGTHAIRSRADSGNAS